MRSPHHPLHLAALCGLLALSLAACGEIELPQPVTPEQTDKPDNTEKPGQTDKPDNTDEPETPSEQIIGSVKITADGHLLINDTFYLSTTEFVNVAPASGPPSNEAANCAASYKEGDLTGWHIPTMSEVDALRKALACTSPFYAETGLEELPKLNDALNELKLVGIFREWYLCADANYVFDFITGDEVKKASKSKKYRLRLTREK